MAKNKTKKPTRRARKVSIMLGLVPVERPRNDSTRRRAEQLRPIVSKPRTVSRSK